MTLWLMLAGGLLMVAATIYAGRRGFDYRSSDGWLAFALLAGIAALVLLMVPTIVLPSRAVGSTTCRHWGEQTGYATKFQILNWADTGTCLARTSGDHWVKNTSVIINVPEKP